MPAGRTKPWGTTQAILLAADAIHEPFAAINADDFYGAESYRELAAPSHLRLRRTTPWSASFCAIRSLTSARWRAAFARFRADGYLEDIVELTKIERDGNGARNTDAGGKVTKLTGDEPVSMNMWGFTPRVFDQLRERFEKFLERNAADSKAECYIPKTVGELVRMPARRASKCCTRTIPGSASPIAKTARAWSKASAADRRQALS